MGAMINKNFKSERKGVASFTMGDTLKNDNADIKIKTLDHKVQRMLFWSNIAVLCGYEMQIVMILRIYASQNGKHVTLLTVALILVYVAFGALFFYQWKRMAHHGPQYHMGAKAYLNYQLTKFSSQCKLIFLYVLAYSILLGTTIAFFMADTAHGLQALSGITLPVSAITYIMGIYFMINFTMKKNNLKRLIAKIDHITAMEKVSQN
jgi:hypothetical protein